MFEFPLARTPEGVGERKRPFAVKLPPSTKRCGNVALYWGRLVGLQLMRQLSGNGGFNIMRQVLYRVASSVDGYISGPHGEIDWIVHDPTMNLSAVYDGVGTVLLGRRTYELTQQPGAQRGPGAGTSTCSRGHWRPNRTRQSQSSTRTPARSSLTCVPVGVRRSGSLVVPACSEVFSRQSRSTSSSWRSALSCSAAALLSWRSELPVDAAGARALPFASERCGHLALRGAIRRYLTAH